MRDASRGRVPARVAVQAQAQAQLDVVAVAEEPLVEAAGGARRAPFSSMAQPLASSSGRSSA